MITDPRLLLPKAHRFPDVVADNKRGRIHERHVAPLNRLVEEINAGREAHLAPWFDPDGGGTSARVLLLLENPGRRATSARGSGFISADNDDDTAATFFRLRGEACRASGSWWVSSSDLAPVVVANPGPCGSDLVGRVAG